MWKEYIDYINDNPKGYWFKRKLYGWGWTPATWQGWIVMAVFAFSIAFNVARINVIVSNSEDVTALVLKTVALVGIIILVCYLKGEPPKWMWGIPKKDEVEKSEEK